MHSPRALRRALLTALSFWVAASLTAPPAFSTTQLGARKVALVIGSGDYGGLKVSGRRDAEAMSELLRRLDFEVVEPKVPEGSLQDWRDALAVFKERIDGAALVVVFYSGHGFQFERRNFLLPKNGGLAPTTSLPVEEVLDTLKAAPEFSPKLVFINACRDSSAESAHVWTLADPGPLGPHIVQSFAASPDQLARSGSEREKARSPYTLALLRYFGEPGLRLVDMLARIRDDVSSQYDQEPRAWGFEPVGDFYIREPVKIDVLADDFDDGLSVILNGDVVLDGTASKGERRTVSLRSGRNDLSILVFNSPTFQDHQSWQVTEGWSYRVRLFSDGGLELPLPQGRLAACEDHPFKNGLHHGGAFAVAKAEIYVDPVSAAVEIRETQTDLHERDLPYYARNQGLLYSKSLEELDPRSHPELREHLAALDSLRTFLTLVSPSAVPIPETRKLFVEVRGNFELLEAVGKCMDTPARRRDRLEDAARSVETLLKNLGEKRPFQSFDLGLSACVREEASPEVRARLGPEDLLIWTAFSTTREEPRQETCVVKPF